MGREKAWRMFLGEGPILYLEMSVCYTATYICQNSLNYTLKIYMFHYKQIMPQYKIRKIMCVLFWETPFL